MNFNITSKHLRIVIVVVGIAFIAIGVLKGALEIEFLPDVTQEIYSYFFIGVAVLFVYMKKLQKKEDEEQDSAEQATNIDSVEDSRDDLSDDPKRDIDDKATIESNDDTGNDVINESDHSPDEDSNN